MNVNAQIIGLDPIQRRLRAAAGAFSNLRPMLTEIGETVITQTQLRFVDSESPDGSKWAPLSAVTLARRRKGNGPNKDGPQPLLDNRRLFSSIDKRVDANSVFVGTNVIYARMHQFGAAKGAFGVGKYKRRKGSFPIPWGNVPARPFLGFGQDDQAEIIGIIQRRINEAGAA